MKVNPFHPLYLKGHKDGRISTIKEFDKRFQKLQQTKGIGPKTLLKIVEVMNLPIEKKE